MPNPDIARIAEEAFLKVFPTFGWGEKPELSEGKLARDAFMAGRASMEAHLAALTDYAERLRGALDELLSMTAVRDAASKASKEFMIHKRACEALNSTPADFVEIAKAKQKVIDLARQSKELSWPRVGSPGPPSWWVTFNNLYHAIDDLDALPSPQEREGVKG